MVMVVAQMVCDSPRPGFALTWIPDLSKLSV